MAKKPCTEPDADDLMMQPRQMMAQDQRKPSSARPKRGPRAETRLQNALKGKFK